MSPNFLTIELTMKIGLSVAEHAEPEQVIVAAFRLGRIVDDRGGVGVHADGRDHELIVEQRRYAPASRRYWRCPPWQ